MGLSLPLPRLSAFPLRPCRRPAKQLQVIPDIRGRWARVDWVHTEVDLPFAQSHMSSSHLPPDDSNTLLKGRGSRRSFLRSTAVAALAGGVLAACKRDSDDLRSEGLSQKPPVAKVGPDSDHSGGTMAAHPAAVPAVGDADKMDAMHEAGIKAFPAKTAGKGNQLLVPVMDGKTKVFNLTARPIKWETAPGTSRTPGPTTTRFRVR